MQSSPLRTAIHFQIPESRLTMGGAPIPDQCFSQIIDQAEQAARETLLDLGFPHGITRVDRREDPRDTWPNLVYGVSVELQGPGEGSGALDFGWRQDPRNTGEWSGHNSCRTDTARRPRKTREAAAAVVHAWSQRGLVTHVEDDTRTYERTYVLNQPRIPEESATLIRENCVLPGQLTLPGQFALA